MKLFLDFLPILLFFAAYKLGDIYIATGVAILASLVQVLFLRVKTGQFEKMSLFTLLLISILGGATLLFRDELFIKWKPTVLYWLLAVAFLISQFIGQKPLIQRAAERGIQLPKSAWQRLNLLWVLFFVFMGSLNLFVVHHYDTDTWVSFKLFGTLVLTLIFVLLQSLYMIRLSKNAQKF